MKNSITINNCPFCGEGNLSHKSKDVEYKYKGHTLLISQPGTYCSSCEEAILEPADLKHTRIDLQAFRARVDGILEPKEVRRIRKALGLKQKEAGQVFGGGHNAFSRYELGELSLPKPVSILLKLLDKHKDLRKEVVS